jgi:hypothetical protein
MILFSILPIICLAQFLNDERDLQPRTADEKPFVP